MAKEPLETIRAVHLILTLAAKLELQQEHLLGLVGMDISQLQDMEARVPARTVMALWDLVVEKSGKESLGLSVGQGLRRDPGDVVSALLFNSATLGEGMAVAGAYFRLVSEGHWLAGDKIGENFRLKFVTHPSLPQGHIPTTEAILSWVAKLYLSIAKGKPLFEEVLFRHGFSGDIGPYTEHFKAPVRFNQDCSALILKPGVLNLPNPAADPAMVEILERYAADRTAALPPDSDFLEDARTVTAKLLRAEGFFGKEQIARKLGVSPRTLYRRLSQAGTTFQELLESVRREVSLECLENPRFTIQDAAFMAGYGGQQAFSRAFVRWYGVPPARYRRRQSPAPGG